jgi:hypothetical protein
MVIDLPDEYERGNNRLDVYDFHIAIPVANNSWAARVITAITLPVGILRRTQIFFPPGCHNKIRCNLYHGATQLLPTDPIGAGVGTYYLTGDDYWFDIKDMFELIDAASTAFIVNAWNIGAASADVYYEHVIDLYAHVERVAVP